MHILITGGLGYIGSNISNWLIGNHVIHILDDFSSKAYTSFFNLKRKNVIFHHRKIHDYYYLIRLFEEYKIELVIHLAAKKNITESLKYPAKYIYENHHGTMSLIKAMIEQNVRNLIFSSTAAVYMESEQKVNENSRIAINNAYSQSKLRSEEFIKQNRQHFDNSIILRYFNPAGSDSNFKFGEDIINSETLFSNITKSLISGKVFEIYGDDYNTPDGSCVRDIINIKDLCSAHEKIINNINKKTGFNIFNIGTEYGVSVKMVADEINKIMPRQLKYKITKRRPNDISYSLSCSKKFKKTYDWKIKYWLNETCIEVLKFNKVL